MLDLLQEIGMLGCRVIDTPIEQNHRIGADLEEGAIDRESYQRLVGRLIYLSHTRPDIAYVVGVASQFMHSPKESHLKVVHHILHYLKGSPGKGILFKKCGHVSVEAYTDADYAGSLVDIWSTSGYCTFLVIILSHGEVRNKMWWLDLVRRLNLDLRL